MSTAIKNRMIPTLFAAALVVAALVVVPNMISGSSDDPTAVVVSVGFTPATRSGKPAPGRQFPDSVSVILVVGGAMDEPKQLLTASPWTRTLHPPRGTVVELDASQVYGEQLWCFITQMDVTVSDKGNGPSSVKCKHKVK